MRLMRALVRRRSVFFAFVILVMLLVIASAAPLISPYDPDALNLAERLQAPSSVHLFGTDHFGRDILSRVLFGTRIALLLGLSIAAFSVFFGVPIGTLSGYYDSIGTYF